MMAFAMPLVVEKSATVNLGGVRGMRNTLSFDIPLQTRADLHAMLVGIAKEETTQQIRLDNPPQIVEVDGRTNIPFDQAKAKIVVLFGTHLAAGAMRMVESELRAAINASTRARSFKLQNVSGAWEWRFIPKGGAARIVTAANPPATLARGDRLVLVPFAVPYAAAVNRLVANSGRLNARTNPLRRGKDGIGKPAPKNSQNLGFLGATTRAVRRRSEFKEFAVIVEFTTAHAVAGEVYAFTRGGPRATGVITIRPRFKQVRYG